MSAPSWHHVVVDLTPFRRDNSGEVFMTADRRCGPIKARMLQDDARATHARRASAGLA